MSDTQISATGAPAWQQAVMWAMAHYGMNIVDTNGPGDDTIAPVYEHDRSFTSFDRVGPLARFFRRAGGASFSPLSGGTDQSAEAVGH